MSTPWLRVPLCTFSVMLLAFCGCEDSLTTDETAVSDPTATVEPAPAETAAADPTTTDTDATTADPADASTPDDPMPEESTELAAVTPVVPETPTVPATPEPETPTEPETPAEPDPLGIGDPAPPLAIAQWVTGEPIDSLATGQVYVVEFWATWCGPCKVSMPHMSELQEHYGDEVQFVGVTREDVDTVQGFLEQDQSEGKTWNEVVTYRLATDLDDTMNQSYMRAAGQNGIPCAFIVGTDGVIEWIGHPMAMEEPLAKVVSGEWNRGAAIAELELRNGLNEKVGARQFEDALAQIEQFETEFGSSSTVTGYKLAILQMAGRADEANALQGEVVEQNWDDSTRLYQIASSIAIGRGAGDLELALRAAERASELTEHQDPAILATVAKVYNGMGDAEKATEWQSKAVDQAWDNSQMLNQIAWGIATGSSPGDLELAQKAGERASELTNHEDESILDTVARVYYEQGNLEKAVEWQTKAVEAGGLNPQIRASLEQYQAELAEKDATPEEGEATPEESATPEEETAEEASPEEATPEEAAPEETAPEESASESDAAPEETTE